MYISMLVEFLLNAADLLFVYAKAIGYGLWGFP